MKKKDKESLRAKEVSELKKLADEKKLEADMAYAKIKAGHEKNVKKSFLLRKELARILTIIREKEIAGEVAEVKKEEK